MKPRPESLDPRPLGDVLSHLFALRGYGRVQADRRLRDLWRQAAGEQIAARTRVLGLKNGVLQIGVANAALLSELAAFHRTALLEALRKTPDSAGIRDLKFRLKSTEPQDGPSPTRSGIAGGPERHT